MKNSLKRLGNSMIISVVILLILFLTVLALTSCNQKMSMHKTEKRMYGACQTYKDVKRYKKISKILKRKDCQFKY